MWRNAVWTVKIDQLWHEAPEDREAPRPGGAGGSSAGSDCITDLFELLSMYFQFC